MNREHTALLFNKFKFFGQSRWSHLPFHKAIQSSVMPFGFECGDGWFPLLLKLCEDIEPLVDDKFEVLQVKEKFGGLRFYAHGGWDADGRVDDLIHAAEKKSYETCETCGRPAKQRGHGWIYTECWWCWYKHKARHKVRGWRYHVKRWIKMARG